MTFFGFTVLPNGKPTDAATSSNTSPRGEAGSLRPEVSPEGTSFGARHASVFPTIRGTEESLADAMSDQCFLNDQHSVMRSRFSGASADALGLGAGAGELVSGKAPAGGPCGARVTRSGKIKARVPNRPNVVLGLTLGLLALVSVYALVTMNYGKVPFFAALGAAASDFVTMMLQPGLAGHFTLPDVVEGLFVSLALALLTTFIGAVIAFVLGLLAASNLSSKGVSNAIKVVMSVIRAVPTILWVLVFSVAIGLRPEAAVIGLLFHGVAYLVKAYSESFEEVDSGVIEALRASGATWWQVVFQGVVPEKVNEMLSWTFIRFEINFVNAVAVGAVAGAGGIGYQLFLAGSFYYNIHEVGLIVYLCLAVAVVLEVIATRLRRRYIVQH